MVRSRGAMMREAYLPHLAAVVYQSIPFLPHGTFSRKNGRPERERKADGSERANAFACRLRSKYPPLVSTGFKITNTLPLLSLA